VQSLDYCRAHKELKIYAWVILDSHFHAILSAPELARFMADLKRHTARRLSSYSRRKKPNGS
jgi:REP element-mobilizing transposase RayT